MPGLAQHMKAKLDKWFWLLTTHGFIIQQPHHAVGWIDSKRRRRDDHNAADVRRGWSSSQLHAQHRPQYTVVQYITAYVPPHYGFVRMYRVRCGCLQ